ncbi:S41 family peptidase [Fibrobacter sp. UWEL]|uniref:S41 family peptidase n=1 Tax=Fibrobacter sp. UWEL TaxID=1896209 RepID=UPI001160DAA4|nr:S41 family peptidase [Fibrobacter sp. UWEL]
MQRQYLFEDELEALDPEGDSVQALYSLLSDPYTRYIPPSKSEAATTSMNTSIVAGDVGMEYYLGDTEYPLFVYRVYPSSPAGRAGIPRYGNIIEVNGIQLTGERAYDIYDSVLSQNKEISLTIIYKRDSLHFDLTKEDVYAPTVLLDTLNETEFIIIRGFKQTTADKEYGSYGELKSLLESLPNDNVPRVLDLRDNPGGHVNQCVAMADLFVKSGKLSTRSWRDIEPDGKSIKKTKTIVASAGDAGEGKPFIILLNKSSASCSEIFAAAVAEGADIPVVGTASYGKGIGQTTWSTIDKGLAIITNLEFLTPKGNSYHKKGIQPDYACESGATVQCALEAIQKIYGKKSLEKIGTHITEDIQPISRQKNILGGAYLDL